MRVERREPGSGEAQPAWSDRALLSPLGPAVLTAGLVAVVAGLLWTTAREERLARQSQLALDALTAARGVSARLDALSAEVALAARRLSEGAVDDDRLRAESARLRQSEGAAALLLLDREARALRHLADEGADAPLPAARAGPPPEIHAAARDARGRGLPLVAVWPPREGDPPSLAFVAARGAEPDDGAVLLLVPVPAFLEGALSERAPNVVAANEVRLLDPDGEELGSTGPGQGDARRGLELPVPRPDGARLRVDVRPLPRGRGAATAALLAVATVVLSVALLWTLWGQRRQLVRRRRAERSLAESERRYRHVFENAPVGISRHDDRGVCTAANDAFAELLGTTRAAVVGLDVLSSPPEPAFVGPLREALAGRRASFEGPGQATVGGAERWLRVTVEPLGGTAGEGGAVALVEDVTAARDAAEERRRHEERERQTRHMEGLVALAGGIAHDFNNLLATVQGNAELLAEELAPDAPQREYLGEIERAARDAAALAEQMLVAAGRGRTADEEVDVSAVVARAAALTRPALPPGVDLRLRLGDGLPPVRADRDQLRQVLVHLLLNAAEALDSRGGRVEVATGVRACDRAVLARTVTADALPEGRYVFLSVKDDGCGMDEAVRARIFEPFFSTRFTGRGLGLAAVLGIVRAHGGGVQVETAPGAGSTFTVLLPVPEPSAVRSP
jgi:PAS domain S-box-containing protein